MDYELVAGDTGSKLVVTIVDNGDGTAVDLTGATVNLRWRANRSVVVVGPKDMTVTDAPGGIAEYLFEATELVAGIMEFEVEVIDAQARKVRNLAPIVERVRAPF